MNQTVQIRNDSRQTAREAVCLQLLIALIVLIPVAMLSSCAPSRAYFDRTATEKIIWPGPPERPRIQYLWSLSNLSSDGEGRRGLREFIAGDVTGDVTDPQTSNVLLRPYSIFVDGRERMHIADPGAFRVSVIDMKTLEVFHIFAAGEQEFVSPIGVAADLVGRIYVSDSELKKVFIFSDQGKYIKALEGEFKRPTGLALDAQRARLYVTDTLEHMVFIYDLDGKRLGSIGKPGSLDGEFNFPTHLSLDKDGLLYVNDAMNFRVQIFGPEGNLLGKVGGLGDEYYNLEKPKGIGVDTFGNIYVVDSTRDTVKIFDRQGRLLLFFGSKGFSYGEFWLPAGMFIDAKNTIYIADPYNMRVQAFRLLSGE
jgi:sugar lactone lactonase YvrE